MQFCSEGSLRRPSPPSQEFRSMIPRVDLLPLFGPPSPAREAVDRAIMAAAEDIGFLTIAGLPPEIPHGPEVRRDLLRIFALPPSEIRKLWRQKFDPRGPMPIAAGSRSRTAMRPTRRASIWGRTSPMAPRHRVRRYSEGGHLCRRGRFARLARGGAHALPGDGAVSTLLMRSLARGLGLAGDLFDAAFAGGIATLRLIHYPPRRILLRRRAGGGGLGHA